MRYILFAFTAHEALGGIDDMITYAASVKELLGNIKVGTPYTGATQHFDVGNTYLHRDGRSIVWYDTIQIVDVETLKTVVSGCNGEYAHHT